MANPASFGGTWNSSHPIQCSNGIGIHSSTSVHNPIKEVIAFE